jgi:hypothetical protein
MAFFPAIIRITHICRRRPSLLPLIPAPNPSRSQSITLFPLSFTSQRGRRHQEKQQRRCLGSKVQGQGYPSSTSRACLHSGQLMLLFSQLSVGYD